MGGSRVEGGIQHSSVLARRLRHDSTAYLMLLTLRRHRHDTSANYPQSHSLGIRISSQFYNRPFRSARLPRIHLLHARECHACDRQVLGRDSEGKRLGWYRGICTLPLMLALGPVGSSSVPHWLEGARGLTVCFAGSRLFEFLTFFEMPLFKLRAMRTRSRHGDRSPSNS